MPILTPFQRLWALDVLVRLQQPIDMTGELYIPDHDTRLLIAYGVLSQRGGVTTPYDDEMIQLLTEIDIEAKQNPHRIWRIMCVERYLIVRNNVVHGWTSFVDIVRTAIRCKMS